MPPTLLFDLTDIDLDHVAYDVAAIEAINPQRGDMRQLDGVIWADEAGGRAVAVKQVKADEFWVPGHIPGRPLYPGVLMIEAAAQLSGFVTLKKLQEHFFLGFAGVDEVKFRAQVTPGDRLILLAELVSVRRRRAVCRVQGLVGQTMVFEAVITGMPL